MCRLTSEILWPSASSCSQNLSSGFKIPAPAPQAENIDDSFPGKLIGSKGKHKDR